MLVAWVAFYAAWRDLRVSNTGTYYAALLASKTRARDSGSMAGENCDLAYSLLNYYSPRPQSVHSPMSLQYFVDSRDSGDH